MIKKIKFFNNRFFIFLFIVFGIIFLFISKNNEIYAQIYEPKEYCGLPWTYCGEPQNYCCHDTGGCQTGSDRCNFIPWYGWCYAQKSVDCCATWSNYSYCVWGGYGDPLCYSGWNYKYHYNQCQAVDSCTYSSSPHLVCGLCDTTGCSKCSWVYKQCCDNITGADCSNRCSNIGVNYQGVCDPNCHWHNLALGDPPCTAVGPTPTKGPTPTPGGPTPTPSLPDCGNTCLNYGTASVAWPDCSCTRQSPASGYEIIGTWNSRDCPNCTGYRQIGAPTPTPRPPTPTPGGPTPTPTTPPAPSCSLSLAPDPLSLQAGGSALLTANVNVQNTTVTRVDFTSGNSSIATVNPATVFSAPYTTQITGQSSGNTTITATATTNPPVAGCTDSVPVSVEARAWFQTQGGDVHAQGNLFDNIPEGANDPNLSITLPGENWWGVITHQDPDGVNLGAGYPSNNLPNHWLAESSYEGKPYGTFQFFRKKFAMELQDEDFGETWTEDPADGVYYANSDRTISGSWDVGAGQWVVLLVEGNITINTRINVADSGFLAVVATGNITFDDGVGRAEGMFVADGTISTGSGPEEFTGEGVFAGNNFSLGRDFNDDEKNKDPVELFRARPDFIMSSYKDADNNLWWFFQKWQELAP